MEGEAVLRKAGCKLVFPEVAQLLKFLVEYGKCQEKTVRKVLYRSSKQSNSLYKGIYIFSL